MNNSALSLPLLLTAGIILLAILIAGVTASIYLLQTRGERKSQKSKGEKRKNESVEVEDLARRFPIHF